MRRLTEIKLIFGFVLIFGILCVNALVLTSNMQTVTRNRESVLHSLEVRSALESVFSTVQDAETGQRGFLLTGEKPYLKPYTLARDDMGKRMTRLIDDTRGNEILTPRVVSFQRAIETKLAELQETIQLQQQGRSAEAITIVLSDRGKIAMDGIRTLKTDIENSDQRILTAREEESRASEQKTRATFSGATIASLILLVIVYVVIVRAVAERRRSAEAIQKREEWLSTTLRSIGDAVMATDEAGAVLFMNRIAEQLTGWPQDEATGKDANSIFIIVNEATREPVKSPVSQVLEENRIIALANHTVLIAKDNTETFIDDSAAPIHDSAGKMVGVVLVFRDIGERKSAQQQRESSLADLEVLNNRLQRAVTETHHRIKNNLQLISSMVSLHSQEGDGTLSSNEVKRLGKSIETLAAVQDVLTTASKRGKSTAEVSTKEVLEQLLVLHRQSAGRHVITASLEEVRLPGSQGTALALLANELLANAIKHGNSSVNLNIRVDAPSNSLEMCVTDDGPGFAPGFDPVKDANTGLELMLSLATWDLRGELHFGNHVGGAEVKLRMPMPDGRGTSE